MTSCRRALMAGAAVVALGTGACSGGFDDGPAPNGAEFVEPSHGDEVSNPFTVRMEAEEVEIVAADEGAASDQGHFHILVDVPCAEEGEVIPQDAEDEGYWDFAGGETTAELDLEPGEHDLCLQVGDADHRVRPQTHEIEVTVEG